MSKLSKEYRETTGCPAKIEEVGGRSYHYSAQYVKWLEQNVKDLRAWKDNIIGLWSYGCDVDHALAKQVLRGEIEMK